MRSVRARLVAAALVVPGLVAALGLSACAAPAPSPTPEPVRPGSVPPQFGGRRLVVLSDADMVATAYTDGRLGPPAGDDRLSVVPVTGADAGAVSGVAVTNSVVAQPAAVALSPGGALAAVAETTGPRTPTATTLTQLPDGSHLTLVSLRGPTPQVLQTLQFDAHPETVDFSPDGRTLAVTLGPAEHRQLALVPVTGDRLGTPTLIALPGVTLPAGATRATQVDWHPSSRFLGVTLPSLDEEAFFRVSDDRATLTPWGPPLRVGDFPFMGRFTPDGRAYVVSSTRWNLGVDAPPGEVAVTRFDTDRPGDVRVVSRASASYGPEGLTISPDGRYVVTDNIEFSANPAGDPHRTDYTSISLFSLDPATAQITHDDDAYSDAVLTESSAVDTTGTWLAVTAFQKRDDPDHGAITFWQIVDDRDSRGPKLVATDYAVTLPRGPHTMLLDR